MHSRTILLLTLALTSCAAIANSGDADPAFGTGGIALIDFTPLSGAPGSVRTAATAVDNQGRVWVAASVQGAAADGLGLARLKRDGTPDGSFGTAGLIYAATGSVNVFGTRAGPDGKIYLGYADQPTGSNGNGLTWRVCRLAEDGSFDSSFYGHGCASFVAPYPSADTASQGTLPVDMQVNPADASVWVLASHEDHGATPITYAVVAAVDQSGAGAVTAPFPRANHEYTPVKGAFNSGGQLFFTGRDIDSTNPSNVYTSAGLAYIDRSGVTLSATFIDSPLATPFGSANFNYGRCIAVDQVTGAVHVGIADIGSQWAAIDTFDANYGYINGSYVGQGTSIFKPATIANESFELNDCVLADDGSFSLAGKWNFNDPVASSYTSAAIIQRLDPHGTGDATFNGDTPGTFPDLNVDVGVGAVADYVRTSTDRVRGDSATSISARHGPLVVGVVSLRLNTAYKDVAVMRLLTDDIFNDGLEP